MGVSTEGRPRRIHYSWAVGLWVRWKLWAGREAVRIREGGRGVDTRERERDNVKDRQKPKKFYCYSDRKSPIQQSPLNKVKLWLFQKSHQILRLEKWQQMPQNQFLLDLKTVSKSVPLLRTYQWLSFWQTKCTRVTLEEKASRAAHRLTHVDRKTQVNKETTQKKTKKIWVQWQLTDTDQLKATEWSNNKKTKQKRN